MDILFKVEKQSWFIRLKKISFLVNIKVNKLYDSLSYVSYEVKSKLKLKMAAYFFTNHSLPIIKYWLGGTLISFEEFFKELSVEEKKEIVFYLDIFL